MPVRIPRTSPALYSRWLSTRMGAHPAVGPVQRWEVTIGTGRVLGHIEYVGIPVRGSGGTRYGWRPWGSGWTASQLQTKAGAARSLLKRTEAST